MLEKLKILERLMKSKKVIIIYVLVLIIIILKVHEVDNSLTEEDKKYISLIIQESISENKSYEEEIKLIESIQRKVRTAAKYGEVCNNDKGIDLGNYREPKDIYQYSTELCFDISRTLEKALRYHSFETRHISLYSMRNTNSKVKSLFTPGVASHAFLEVFTKKGWLVVDSTDNWLSINDKGMPVSLNQMQTHIDKGEKITWQNKNINAIFNTPFIYVYGLYSRHGKFYPPFNSIPDIEYREFMYNLID